MIEEKRERKVQKEDIRKEKWIDFLSRTTRGLTFHPSCLIQTQSIMHKRRTSKRKMKESWRDKQRKIEMKESVQM